MTTRDLERLAKTVRVGADDECNLSIIAAVHASGRRQVPGPIEEARHHLHPPGMMSP